MGSAHDPCLSVFIRGPFLIHRRQINVYWIWRGLNQRSRRHGRMLTPIYTLVKSSLINPLLVVPRCPISTPKCNWLLVTLWLIGNEKPRLAEARSTPVPFTL